MVDPLSDSLEHEVRKYCEKGDHARAAARTVEGYGPEVFGFLVTSLKHRQDAEDVFSQLCEDLFRGLPAFEWRSSLRTWLYRLARNATTRHLRSPARRASRRVPLSQISEVAERVRTETALHLKTEAKDALARVRDALAPEDRMLLVLRIDRRLAWNDIARVLDEPDLSEKPLERAAARLRKRFQELKEEIARRLEEET
jgi:RNA polymerase sigma-70 factor (ECF subfamily)